MPQSNLPRPSILAQPQSQNLNHSQGQSHTSAAKTRQYAQLHAQLEQLNANLTDTETLVRMTAAQAGDLRFLGGYVGALFMGSATVLGEEGGVRGNAEGNHGGAAEGKRGSSESEED